MIFQFACQHLIPHPTRSSSSSSSGVPVNTGGFLSFLHTAMALQNKAHGEAKKAGEEKYPPLVVHCSAGVGRTGVFCLVYSVLTYLPYVNKGGKYTLDILATVRRMRKYRRYLVQTEEQYQFCYTTILSAARYYRDGSKQLQEKKKGQKASTASGAATAAPSPPKPAAVAAEKAVPVPVSVSATPPPPVASTALATAPGADPVWLHVCAPDHAEELLQEDGFGSDSQGRFLLFATRRGATPTLCYIHDGKLVHVALPQVAGQVCFGEVPVPGCSTYLDLIDRLRQPREAQFYAPGVTLHDYVPREDSTPEELRREDDKATQFWRRVEHQRRASVSTFGDSAVPDAPPLSKDGSRTSVTSTASAASSNDDGSGGRRRGVISRFSNSLRKKMGPKKDKERKGGAELPLAPGHGTLPEEDESESEAAGTGRSETVSRLGALHLPAAAVTRSPVRAGGDVLQLSGRANNLTFLNAIYVELEQGLGSRSVYRCLNPVERSHGHLAGQYVFLYYDTVDKSWVLFLPSTGAVACVSTLSADPTAATERWSVVNAQNVLVPDPAVGLTRLASLPAEDTDSAEASSTTQSELERLRARLHEAEERERMLTRAAEKHKGAAAALSQSQERERELALKLLELREAVAARLGMDDEQAAATAGGVGVGESVVSPTKAAHDQLQRARDRIQELEAQLETAAQVEQTLRHQVNTLTVSEERLARRVERLEHLLDTRTLEAQSAAERETVRAQGTRGRRSLTLLLLLTCRNRNRGIGESGVVLLEGTGKYGLLSAHSLPQYFPFFLSKGGST